MALLSVTEAARRYGLSATHIRRLARTGTVKAQRFGEASWAVDETSLKAYLRKDRRPGPKGLDKRGRKRA